MAIKNAKTVFNIDILECFCYNMVYKNKNVEFKG